MKRLAVAVLALAVLGAGAWLVAQRQRQEALRDRAAARLLDFDDRQVEGLVVTSGGIDWRFRRGADGWRLVAPVEDAADPLAIQELLVAARQTRVTRVLEDPSELSEYGLDPPRGVLRVEGVPAEPLHVGDRAPTGDGVYARVEGRPGVLVLDFLEALQLRHLAPEALRDHSLTGMPGAGLRTLKAERAGAPPLRLVREGERWWLSEPLRLPADAARVERLLGALEESRVDGFLDDADPTDPALGLGPGALSITLEGEGGARTVRLGAAAPGDARRYALRDDRPVVLTVGAGPLEDLPLTVRELASRRLTDVNRYQVVRFDYRRGAQQLAAARGAEPPWRDAGGRELPADPIWALLASLLNAPLEDWQAGTVEGASPRATLEFELQDGSTDRLDFFDGRRARVASRPEIVYRLAVAPPDVPAI